MSDFNTDFVSALAQSQAYQEALSIVRTNSEGRIWLIGGSVYRTLAQQMYGKCVAPKDWDFIIEHSKISLLLPEGWTARENRFGNPKLVKGNQEIDCIPLQNIIMIQKKGLQPTIDNFLICSPLTVQSIAFDIAKQRLLGEQGFDALQRRVVEVQDREIAVYAAQKKRMTLNDYIQEKATSLGFTPIFPE